MMFDAIVVFLFFFVYKGLPIIVSVLYSNLWLYVHVLYVQKFIMKLE